jgi:hypothetical protein
VHNEFASERVALKEREVQGPQTKRASARFSSRNAGRAQA